MAYTARQVNIALSVMVASNSPNVNSEYLAQLLDKLRLSFTRNNITDWRKLDTLMNSCNKAGNDIHNAVYNHAYTSGHSDGYIKYSSELNVVYAT